MAMSGGANKRVGNTGEIRVHAQVISQSISRNESVVRVRGFMRAVSGSSTSYGTADMSTSATSGGTKNWSNRSFSIQGSSWQEVASHEHTVPHRSDGTRPLTATFTLGPTGTSRFGSGGTASVSFNVDRIPRPPSKPSKPTVSSATSSSYKASVSAPASNGASITQYQWQSGNDTFTSSGRSITITGRAPNSQHRVRVRARNSAGWSSWSSWSNYISTKPNLPAAPSNIRAQWSGGYPRVLWDRNATTAAPYSSITVQWGMHDGTNGWQDYSNSNTVAGTATAHQYSSQAPNRAYRYRVRANNAAGSSAWAYMPAETYLWTAPAAPSNATANVTSTGDSIDVAWDNNHYQVSGDTATTLEIQRLNGSTWSNVQTGLSRTTSSWRDNSPLPGDNRYRVRVRHEAGQFDNEGDKYSAWVETNTVSTIAPPLAPTNLSPDGEVTDFVNSETHFTWQHNDSGDGSVQTAYEAQYRVAGSSSSWQTLGSGTTGYPIVPPGVLSNGSEYEWRVRTKGIAPEFGPWSDPAFVPGGTRPTVTLRDGEPGETIGELPFKVAWDYQQDEDSPQDRYEVRVTQYDADSEGNPTGDARVVHRAEGTGENDEVEFDSLPSGDYVFLVEVRARSSRGQWSDWALRQSTVDLLPPAFTELDLEFDPDSGTVNVNLLAEEAVAGITSPPVSFDLQRRARRVPWDYSEVSGPTDDSDWDEDWVTIAQNIPFGGSVSITDRIPFLDSVNEYRAIVVAESSGSGEFGENYITLDANNAARAYVSWGPTFEKALFIENEPDVGYSTERVMETIPLLGRRKPLLLQGIQEERLVDVAGMLLCDYPIGGDYLPSDWETMIAEAGVVCYRDPTGRRLFGAIGRFNYEPFNGHSLTHFNFNFSLTEVDYVEQVLVAEE